MLYFPERITKGDVPNVDFLHLYGPGSLHVLAGWYELFGNTLAAERTFGLLQHVAIIFGLVHAGSSVGSSCRDACRRLRRVLRADADRADGDGLERRAGTHAVVRRVRRALDLRRRPIAAARRRCGRRPRRAGADLPSRPRPRRGRRARLADLEPTCVVADGRRRRRRRADAAVGAPRHRRTAAGVAGHGGRPGRASPCRPGVAPAAVVGSSRRRPAGDRRVAAAVVAPPSRARLAGDLPVVPGDARRHGRPARPGGAATSPWASRRPRHGAPGGGPRQRRHPPAGVCSGPTRPT